MSGDYLFMGPDLMTKYGAMLDEPAALLDDIFEQYRAEKAGLGERPWGHGDEIADTFDHNFVPAEQDFQDYGAIFSDVLRETTKNIIHTAEVGRITDAGAGEFAHDLLKNMPDSPGGPGDLGDLGDPGGLPGGNGWR